jgi:hypothetical protein
MAAAALLNGLDEKWAQATVGHEFIQACISGSIKRDQFDRWLVQVTLNRAVIELRSMAAFVLYMRWPRAYWIAVSMKVQPQIVHSRNQHV